MIPFFSAILCLGLPAFGLWRLQAGDAPKRPWLVAAGSMAFCGIAMVQELFTIKRRVFGGDVGGIQDTIDAVLTLCILLLVVVVLLDLIYLWLSFELEREKAADAQPPRPAGEEARAE